MIQTKCDENLNGLHQHLVILEQLHDRYVSYQTAYNKLVLEMARRRQYREQVDRIVRDMTEQLEEMARGGSMLPFSLAQSHESFAMCTEESKVRSLFNSEYGGHLPGDICLCIGNMPTRWRVMPWEEDSLESLPEIGDDLTREVVIVTPMPLHAN